MAKTQPRLLSNAMRSVVAASARTSFDRMGDRMRIRAMRISLAVILGGCSFGSTPNVDRIDHEAGYYTAKVQHRQDEPARACHRATTAAVVASANVLVRLRRGEAVPAELYRQLSAVDSLMQDRCQQFRDSNFNSR
jgi:hypothetical protein